MKNICFIALALALLPAFGCCSSRFSYEGECCPEPPERTVFAGRDFRPDPAHRLGRAEISGDYDRCSPEELKERLLAEAGRRGADTVVIVAYEIDDCGENSRDLFPEDELISDPGRPQQTVRHYRRTIRADLYREKR